MIRLINWSIQKLQEEARNRIIICYGAGKELRSICKMIPDIVEKISVVVDNNKAGNTVTINDKIIPIIDFDSSYDKLNNSILIISTIDHAETFIDQMNESIAYNMKDVLVSYLICNYIDKNNSKFVFPKMEQVIPKKIHYCWFGDNEIPTKFRENIETWKQFCPDYEIVRWDEDNYDIKKNKYMYQAYTAKKWGFVPDYARLDIIYNEGGIYLDVDVKIIKSFDNLLIYEMFCGYETKDYINLGQGFGGVKHHPIIREMLRDYENNLFINSDGSYNLITSPRYQTETLKRLGYIINGKLNITKDVAIFPRDFFAPYDMYGQGEITNNTFSIHQFAGTWIEDEHRRNIELFRTKIGRIYSKLDE